MIPGSTMSVSRATGQQSLRRRGVWTTELLSFEFPGSLKTLSILPQNTITWECNLTMLAKQCAPRARSRETPRAASPDTGNNPCGLSAMVSGPSRQRRDPRGRYDREKKEPQSTGRERGTNSSEKRASNLGVRAMVPSSTQGTTRAEQDSADDTSCGDGGRHGHGRNARRRWGANAHKTQHARLSRPASLGGDCTN